MTDELPPAADAGAGGEQRRTGGEYERAGGDAPRSDNDRPGRRVRGGAHAPEPWVPQQPTSQTLELLRTRLPLSIRLIGRSSLPGALLVLAIAFVFIGAVPLAATLQLDAAQATGEVISVGNEIELTVAEDWRIDSQDGRATVLSSGSSQLVVIPAYEESRSSSAVVAAEIAAVEGDQSSSWVTGEPETFTTEAGDTGVTISASSETNAREVWAVSHDGLTTVAVLSTTIESWAIAEPQAQAMVDSLVFADDSAGVGP
ncbi:hypothetical protein ACNI3K_01785 [Demequina sp. SO4-13]|uniref:hypothetical protein n=1 Tax=Demequina sp. SO4-13 TaxID=3401027 RepID=UPI003AF8259C